MSTNKIIKCRECGQKNKINEQLIDKAKCGRCGSSLKRSSFLDLPAIIFIFPVLWIIFC